MAVRKSKKRAVKRKNPRYLVTARQRQVKDVDLGILQDKSGKAAVRRAKSLYAGRGYTAIKAKKQNPKRRRNRTVIKAKRVTVLSANPCGGRSRNARITQADLARLPAHVQQQFRAQLGAVEKREEKAVTPAQKKAAAKSRRSFLSRLGTRLRVIGQTKKMKVSARDLGRCPRKTIKVRARHETDALAKARAKLGDRYDQLKVANGRKRSVTQRSRRKPGKSRNAASPKVRQIREKFTGTKSRKTATMNAPQGTPRNLAKLGRLVLIKTQRGTIRPAAKNPGGAVWLCADAKGKLHLCTTAARLVDGPARSFGEVSQIEYEASKPHLGHKRPMIFFHKMGEEGGRRPELVADGKGGLKFKGGSYKIASEGIRD